MAHSQPKLEVWLRGPLPDIPGTLQPIAHALLQALEELESLLSDFPESLLWERPADVASVGFHLQHIAGVLDRLFTYARGEALTEKQLAYLKAEGEAKASKAELLKVIKEQIAQTLETLQNSSEEGLLEPRKVGRKGLPSTVLGLYTHAAEHTMRHLGQVLVTVKILHR
ncbi:MAG: DinB family protein [Trueperaceae bacterium]|nr:DinB family protein [Trueperaceae bacterium]